MARLPKGVRSKKQIRVDLIQQFGGGCQECGYNRCQRVLHFHHLDPSAKKDWSGDHGGAAVEEVLAHPERFRLLCSNCHIEEHERLLLESRIEYPCAHCGEMMRAPQYKIKMGLGRYCSKDCANQDAYKKSIASIPDRIAKHTVQEGECLVWTGYCTKSTPTLNVAKACRVYSPQTVPKLVWELANGPIAVGMEVWRTCENLKCVRLEHLILKTRKEMRGWLVSRGMTPKGNDAPWSKLDESQVREIRRLASEEGLNPPKIAPLFGVTRESIRDILSGKRWRHLE